MPNINAIPIQRQPATHANMNANRITLFPKVMLKMHYNHMSAQREHDKNLTVVVRSMCMTPRKIVRNIIKCHLIICICSGKYRKIYSAKFLKSVYLTWQIFLTKIERSFLIVISESLRILVNPTVIFLWVHNSNLKKRDMNRLLYRQTCNRMYFYAPF